MVSRARLVVRRRYRDDVRLDSPYAKTGWQWCHVLVLVSFVTSATTSASTRITLTQGGSGVTVSSRQTGDEGQIGDFPAKNLPLYMFPKQQQNG